MIRPKRLDPLFERGLQSVERIRGGATVYKVVFGERRPPLILEPVNFDDLEPPPRKDDSRFGWVLAVVGHIGLIALSFLAFAPDAPRDTIPEQGMMVELISEPDTVAGERTEIPASAGKTAPIPDSDGTSLGAKTLASPREAEAKAAPAAGTAAMAEPPAPSFAAGPATPDRREVPAASGTVASGAGSISPDEARWEGEILTRIEKRKRYPKAALAARIEDRIMLRLVIDRDGRLIRSEIARSRGHLALNTEVQELARRASPYPRPPKSVSGEEVSLIVPVEFFVKSAK